MATHIVGAGGFTTIQEAIEAAVDGDIIEVMAGTYTENLQITKSGITLVSVEGRGTVTIQPLDTTADTIRINASDVTIGDVGQGFTIIGADGPPGIERAAIYIVTGPCTTIRDNEIVANGDSGLTGQSGANVSGTVIDSNTFSGQTFAGAGPAGGPSFGDQFTLANVPRQLVVIGANGGDGVTFTNNEITGTAGGISSTTGQPFGNQLVTIDATNSLIEGNTFTGYTTGNAYSLRVGGNGSTVTDNVIDHSVNGSDSLGIVLRDVVTSGTFSGNSFQGDGTSEPIRMTPGDDAIDGGAGPDALLLSGTRAGHTISQNPDGSYTVTDINPADGNNGSDTLENVEGIVFGGDAFAYELDVNSPDFSAALARFSADFETDTSAFLPQGGTPSSLTLEASGAVPSADGASHLRVGTSDSGGAFTRFGGYGQGDTGFVAQTKIFLDTGMAGGEGFDWSVAASNQSGAHLRDFIFHVTRDTDSGNIIIGADNNTNNAPQLNLETKNHVAVDQSGWYTFEHKFYENDAGALEVAMNVYDDAGNWIFTEIRSDQADDFATDFGGSRYGWFTNVDVAGGIAVDSVSLKTLDQNLVEVRDGNTVLGTFATIEDAREAADNGDISGATFRISTLGEDDAFFYVVDGMSIQAAINAASNGDTIEVAAGTYTENLAINKGVIILGANVGIDGAGVRGAETVIDGEATITTTSKVVIDGVRFLDDDAYTLSSSDNYVALQILANSVDGHEIRNSVFHRDPDSDPEGFNPDHGVSSAGQPTHRAIEISNVGAGSSITITGNLISSANPYPYAGDSWRSGIYSNGGDGITTIQGNTFIGGRSAVNADDFGPTVTIADNDFRSPASAISIGIGSDVAEITTITGNIFDRVDTDLNFGNVTTGIGFDFEGTGNSFAPSMPSESLHTIGGSGNDTIVGSSGIDLIDGRGGNDTLKGGDGDDRLEGGGGVDTAVYDAAVTPAMISIAGANWTAATGGAEGTDTLIGIEIVDGAEAGKTLLVGNGGFSSLQAAIDASADGDTILVAAGTYQEKVVIDKSITITGMGDGDDVVIKGTFKSSNGLADDASVANFLKTATGYTSSAGSGITVTADDVSISNILVSSFLSGVRVNADVDNLNLDGVSVDGSVFGFDKVASAALSNFTMTGGTISDAYIGVYFYASAAAPAGLASDILIDGTTFSHLTQKGLYIETLQDAVIRNIVMDNVGQYGGGPAFGANGAHGAGIDINLKYDRYSNIVIENFDFTDVGLSNGLGTPHANAAAIAVKARDDGPSYDGDPASFDGEVIIRNGSINGTSTAIRVGEAGKVVTDPAVTVTNVDISGFVANANHGAVDNVTTSEMTINLADGGVTLAARATATGDFIVNGGAGDDKITGALGSDTLYGGGGNDTLKGGNGVDLLFGGEGNDTIFGGQGNDTLNGGDGNDILNGEGNADTFLFSAGQDIVDGGNGHDTMVLFGSASDYAITIGSKTGDYTFERLSDGSVTKATSIESIKFQQDPPDAKNDSITVDTGDLRTLNVLANDTPAGQVQVIAATLQSGDGKVSVTPGGKSISYDLTGSYASLGIEETATAEISYLITAPGGFVDGAKATVTVNGVDDAVTAPVDEDSAENFVMENAGIGTLVGITAKATDVDTKDTVTYSILDGDGTFAVDAITGVVTLAGPLDAESGLEQIVTVRATSTNVKGGTTVADTGFTVAVGDIDEFDVTAPVDTSGPTGGTILENALGTVGITAFASDADATTNTVKYSLSSNPGGHFAIDEDTGVVSVVSAFDRETDGASVNLTVKATSADGSSAETLFAVAIGDVNEFAVGAPEDIAAPPGGQVTENAANGTSVGITAFASDQDATNNTVTYSLENDDGGRFIISSTTGEVLVAGPIDREAGASRSIVVKATSSDGSSATKSFTIAVDDVDEFDVSTPVDSDPGTNTVAIAAVVGTYTGVTAFATDADATNNVVSYSIVGGTGEFAVGPDGKVVVAGPLDPGGGSSRLVTVQASSSDGSTAQQTFSIAVSGAGLIIDGTAGRDILYGGVQNDQINGKAGNDDLYGLGGNDTLDGGDGNDRLDGGIGDDILIGGDGNDTYTVDSVGDVVIETSTGGLNDIVNSSVTIAALFANVEKLFLTGTDNIDGAGNELANRIDGNAGNNVLSGGDGNDNLNGFGGADTLFGGLGNDTLSGDDGNDILNGGDGKDNLTGGAGADKFVFDLPPSGANSDKIFDFAAAEGDKIVFAGSAFAAIGPTLDAGELRLGTSANAASNRVIYDQATGRLWYDADGNGSGASVLVATLQNGAALGIGDFEIVA